MPLLESMQPFCDADGKAFISLGCWRRGPSFACHAGAAGSGGLEEAIVKYPFACLFHMGENQELVSVTPYNLQYGRAPKGEYPGDKDFKQEDSISFQIHHIKIDQNLHPLNNKDLYNLAIYYPDNLASAYVGFEEDDDEEL